VGRLKRGEIWDVRFPLSSRENSEPYGHGLVVIVSSDAFNNSAIQTILIAVLTSNLKLARAPGNVLILADEQNGIRNDSVINVSQVLVVDKERLVSNRGRLDTTSLELLNDGLKRVFALG
jgi:mRNA interferase MazF